MFVCYAYELCIPKEFSVENEIMRNQGFADICCFKPELLGQSVDYSTLFLSFRHLLKTPLSLLMPFSTGYLRKHPCVINLNI